MDRSAAIESTPPLWSEEPSNRPDRARIRARIGGLHCSLCTRTIERALGKLPGVDNVSVSLTHEQALVEYDPTFVRPRELLQTLRDIGYTISDPRKVRPFEEEERDLVREGKRFFTAIAFSLLAIALNADISGGWSIILPAAVFASLVALLFLVLRRSYGLPAAVGGAVGLGMAAVALLFFQKQGIFSSTAPLMVGAMAVFLIFGIGNHILRMAVQSVRRDILNQHVLLEAGAFAGLAGGLMGLIFCRRISVSPWEAGLISRLSRPILSSWEIT